MFAEHVRDLAVTAAVFGFFAATWFGWAQEGPPRPWRRYLIAGTVVSYLVMLAGIVLAWRHWDDGTVFTADSSRTFGIVVGIEFGAAAAMAVLLTVMRRKELIPVWIAFIVGVHLFPVAAIIEYPLVHVTAVLVTAVVLASLPFARKRRLPVSAVVGAGTGVVLLAAAIASALAASWG
ncbi:hypothetical protein [Actinoplanes utahensis]|uniref:Uncharacterized protein n=1 Tax=Actinoplanes utahensis TaxID=1869 RepID=A0A0A6UMY1_ACTUT|nr:hypothetical protein [Actinoplanes utahensis]KHD77485.1 hypothetical protein MB27_10185 [Actinoplanes utahensis]GIF32619.1 hypothetical protein Aut01nite_56050 [Actinoplanes utahensis]